MNLTLVFLSDKSVLGENVMYAGCFDAMITIIEDSRIMDQFDNYHDPSGETPNVRTFPLPPGSTVSIENNEVWQRVRTDGFGDTVHFTFVEQLKKLVLPEDNVDPRNSAVKAYVDAMPDDIPVVLFWGV